MPDDDHPLQRRIDALGIEDRDRVAQGFDDQPPEYAIGLPVGYRGSA